MWALGLYTTKIFHSEYKSMKNSMHLATIPISCPSQWYVQSHDSASRTLHTRVIGHFRSIILYVSISLHNVVRYCKIWLHVLNTIQSAMNRVYLDMSWIRVWLGLAIWAISLVVPNLVPEVHERLLEAQEAVHDQTGTVLLRLLEAKALVWTWRIHCLDVQITPFSVSASFGNLLSVSCWQNWWF